MLSNDVFWLKFVGTTNDTADYDDMIAATTLGVDRWEIELAVLWIMPVPSRENDGGVSWNHTLWKSRQVRRTFEIEFYPFSNHLQIDGDDVLQNTDSQLTLEEIILKPYVFIATPTTTDLDLPPRYTDNVNFAKTVALLPLRVECDLPAYSKTDEGNTEATMTVYSRAI